MVDAYAFLRGADESFAAQVRDLGGGDGEGVRFVGSVIGRYSHLVAIESETLEGISDVVLRLGELAASSGVGVESSITWDDDYCRSLPTGPLPIPPWRGNEELVTVAVLVQVEPTARLRVYAELATHAEVVGASPLYDVADLLVKVTSADLAGITAYLDTTLATVAGVRSYKALILKPGQTAD